MLLLAAIVVVLAGTATRAGASPVGQGSLALAPATMTVSSHGATMRLVYVTPGSGFSNGAVQVTIPRPWNRPQNRSFLASGYVSASAGVLRVSHRRVKVTLLTLCGGCSLTITYSNVTAPASPRVSTFLVKSSASSKGRLQRLAAQPTVRVIGGAASGVALGDYAGAADPRGIAQFAAATDTHPTLATDYLVASSWSAMDGAGGSDNGQFDAWKGSGYRLVLGVPIIPNSGGTLTAGASGAYNSYFVTLAQNLVSQGLPNTILRLGWEFNENWSEWSVANATDAANFAAYFRNIVTAMRSVAGQRFQFVWNPAGGGASPYTPDQAYPGNAYVDYVGLDTYDACWCTPQTPQNAWSNQLTQAWGLNWLAGFAAQHGKQISFPEWSDCYRDDGHGLGDDPYFINQFAAWVTANNVAFTDIFSFDGPGQQNDITDGSFPKALAAFRSDFG